MGRPPTSIFWGDRPPSLPQVSAPDSPHPPHTFIYPYPLRTPFKIKILHPFIFFPSPPHSLSHLLLLMLNLLLCLDTLYPIIPPAPLSFPFSFPSSATCMCSSLPSPHTRPTIVLVFLFLFILFL